MNSRKNTERFNIFDFCFVKPVPAIIWVGLLSIVGLLAYSSMIKEALPDLEIPQASISVVWPGASPLLVEKEITQKIERQIKGMKGLKQIYSSSRDDVATIGVDFKADMPVAEAMQLLNRNVATVAADLPDDAHKPKVEETSVRKIPIISFALSGDVDQATLESHARRMKECFEDITGIKRAALVGERVSMVHVQIIPERLRATGIPASLVRKVIKQHNWDVPWGQFENPDFRFSMKLKGAFRDLKALEQLVIARLPEGNVIRLADIAVIKKTFMREKTRAALSWKGQDYVKVVAVHLFKASGKDSNDLVRQAKKAALELQKQEAWDGKIGINNLGDEAEVISDELNRGFTNGWQAMLAVFIVLMIMLTWREAIVAAILVPITLLGTTAILWFMGYTFNLLVIVGMILALGLLVDDFILIMEGLHESLFIKRLPFRGAVRYTIKTYAIPSFSGSLTTVLVLIPIVFVGGVDGKFIRIIPIAAAVCLTLSYIVSVFLGPPLSRFVFTKNTQHLGPGWMDRLADNVGHKLMAWLKSHVLTSKKRAFLWVLGAVFLFLLSLDAFGLMRDTLYPKEDGRGLGITVELAPCNELSETAEVADKLGHILQEKPYLQYVLQSIGQKDEYSLTSFHDSLGALQESNIIGFSCFFIPRKQGRDYLWTYVDEIRSELEEALKDQVAAKLYLSPQIGGPSGEDPVQIDIQGPDMQTLIDIAHQIEDELAKVPGVVDVRNNIGPSRMDLTFRPLREALDFHKLTPVDVAVQMSVYTQNEKIGRYRRPGTEKDLDLRIGTYWPSQKGEMGGPKSWQEMKHLAIINNAGKPVPLWSVAEPVMDEAQKVITHKNGERSATVLSKLSSAYVSEVIVQMRPVLDEMKETWPAGYTYEFAGEKEVEGVYKKMGQVFILAMVLVYAILALLFDSLVQPGIVLFSVLCALIGVFGGFFLFDIPFSFTAAIGIVALVGIVVNDAIILIETMNNHIRAGKDITQAALLGASDRLRPIVSTTITNFAGLMPLALSDPGWAPLCHAIIFGEITATIGALIFTPAIFLLVTPRTAATGHKGTQRFALAVITLAVFLAPLDWEAYANSDTSQIFKHAETSTVANKINLQAIKKLDVLTAGQIALENNPSLGASLARTKQAKAVLEQAQASYWPTIDVNASFSRNRENKNDYQSTLASARLFDPDAILHDSKDVYKSGLTATWILFDGFERKHSNLSAQLGQSESKAAFNEAKRMVLISVTKVYYSAQLAKASIAIAKSDEAFNQRLLLEACARTKAGTGNLTDEINFKIHVNAAQVERIKAENRYVTLMHLLATLMGISPSEFSGALPLQSLGSDSVPTLPESSIESLVSYALANRPDVKLQELAVRQAGQQIKIAQANFFPTLNLFASLDGDRSKNVHFEKDDFGNSVGLNVTYNLFAGGLYRSKTRNAMSQKTEAMKNLADIRLKVSSEVHTAHSELTSAIHQLQLQRINQDLVKQGRSLAEKGYLAGHIALVRLNEAQRDLVTANNRFALALVSVHQAAYSLDAAVGKLCDRFQAREAPWLRKVIN